MAPEVTAADGRGVRWLARLLIGAFTAVCVSRYLRMAVVEPDLSMAWLSPADLLVCGLAVAVMTRFVRLPVLALHEAGHALAASLVRARPSEIGVFDPYRYWKLGGRPRLELSLCPTTSVTRFDPGTGHESPLRLATIHAAGPVANIVVAVACGYAAGGWSLHTLLAGFASGRPGAQVLLLFGYANLVEAGLSLTPWARASGQFSDGYALGVIRRHVGAGRPPAEIAEFSRYTHYSARTPQDTKDKIRSGSLTRPDLAVVRKLQAWYFLEAGEYQKALAATQAPRLPADAETAAVLDGLTALAVLHLADPDRYPQAEAASARAFAAKPDDTVIRYARGWVLLETGRTDDGLALLRQAMADADTMPSDLEPETIAEIVATTALGELRGGDRNEARRLLARAEILDGRCHLIERVRHEIAGDDPDGGRQA